MNLGDFEEKKESAQSEIPVADEKGKLLVGDIFFRDIACWVHALLRHWWIILAVALFFGVLFFSIRLIRNPKLYTSSCALVRNEVSDLRHSDLPAGYNPVQLNVIFNMILSRTCLSETARRLNLQISHEQMFNIVSVRQAEKRSNYFFISAVTKRADLSAQIANTLSDVFLDEYKKMIKNNVNSVYQNSLRSCKNLSNELDQLQLRIDEIYAANGLKELGTDFSSISQRIFIAEDRLQNEQNRMEALNKSIATLESELANTQENVVVYQERSTAREQRLTDMKLELAAMLQRYTDKNPQVQNQRKLIEDMEKANAQESSDGQSKVVIGKNISYTNISTELSKSRAELIAVQSKVEGYKEALSALQIQQGVFNKLAPQVNLIEQQMLQKKNALIEQEAISNELKLFLDRSYSDVFVNEEAKPPSVAMPRKLLIFSIVGVVLGFVGCCVFFLLKELFYLRVRSVVDIERGLKLHTLGIIPDFKSVERADFYSSIQEAITTAEKFLRDKPHSPALLAVSAYQQCDDSEFILSEFLEIMSVNRDLKYKIISDISADKDKNYADRLINDFVYGIADELPPSKEEQKLYFDLNDLAFISPPTESQIQRLKEALKKYDVVIWHMFDFAKHRQLFMEICNSAEMVIVPMKFDETSKWDLFKMLKFFNAKQQQKMFGLLYNTHDLYQRKF